MFPYMYQFIGSEGTKWRQIGNSVCPHQSSALAKALRKKSGLKVIVDSKISFKQLENNFNKVNNLNTFIKRKFNSPRKRQEKARFRRHVLKIGNMTVDLMNYHPDKKDDVANNWYVTAFFGTGDGYGVKVFSKSEKQELESILQDTFDDFSQYKNDIAKLPIQTSILQKTYESDLHLKQKSNPILLLKQLSGLIKSYECHSDVVNGNGILQKENIPLAQFMSAYGLLTILNY